MLEGVKHLRMKAESEVVVGGEAEEPAAGDQAVDGVCALSGPAGPQLVGTGQGLQGSGQTLLEGEAGHGGSGQPLGGGREDAEVVETNAAKCIKKARMGMRAGAEREGFEPSDPISGVTSLAMMRIRPLCHLSRSIAAKTSADLEYVLCDLVRGHATIVARNSADFRQRPGFPRSRTSSRIAGRYCSDEYAARATF